MVDDDRDAKEGKENRIGETLKKVFTAGVSAAFMTEESIRGYLAELKLPKEILNTVVQSAAKSKEEIVGRVSTEMISLLRKIDLVKEFSRFAEDHKFKISAEVEIIKKKSVETKKEDESI